jgi:deoxycytidylate deaminase
LQYRNGYRDIQLNQHSGKIVWRRKLRGSIQHTGIELGRCRQTREQLYIHNHPNQRQASIVSAAEFGQGNPIYYENEPCVNTPLQVIEVGLSAVIQRVPYRVMSSNCQNLTNGACKNVSYSQDLNKVIGGVAAAVAIGFLSNQIQKNNQKKRKKKLNCSCSKR